MNNERDFFLLNEYIDGALSPEARQQLEERLEQDPELRRELEELRTTVTLLKAVERVPTPRDFTLDPAVYGKRAEPTIFERIQQLPRYALSAAASIVMVIAAVFLLVNTGGVGLSPASLFNETVVTVEIPGEDGETVVITATPDPDSAGEMFASGSADEEMAEDAPEAEVAPTDQAQPEEGDAEEDSADVPAQPSPEPTQLPPPPTTTPRPTQVPYPTPPARLTEQPSRSTVRTVAGVLLVSGIVLGAASFLIGRQSTTD